MSTVIDPKNVTNYNRNTVELQTWAIFCVCVAGKNADQTAAKVAQLLRECPPGMPPLQWLVESRRTEEVLKDCRMGQYGRITKAIEGLAQLDLETCTIEDLVGIHGIKYKTASMFLLHSRPGCDAVVLDTHVLSWMRKRGWDTPAAAPSSNAVYAKWAAVAAMEMREEFGYNLSMAQIDLLIWTTQSGRDL